MMPRRGQEPKLRQAFTLLELMLVMILIGVIAGIGVAGFDRIDPGYQALESSLTSFLESSRDRARSSGYPVVLELRAASEERPARLLRASFRPVLEASFEKAYRNREAIEVRGDASLDEPGRFGAGVDLEAGGEAMFAGRGLPDLHQGFSLVCDFRDRNLAGGDLLHWEGLLDLRVRKGGVLEVVLQAGDGEYFQDVRLDLPAAALRSNHWQHLRLTAVDELLTVEIDGHEVARTATPPELGIPRSAIRLGSMERGWSGQLDELRVFARIIENGPELPQEVTIEAALPLVFDRHGTLDRQQHPASGVPVVMRAFDEVVARFRVGRFTQEVLL